jgi:rhamnose utilization protein RhaD (predicted bifunctional aldolase and dehydrogenase)
MNNMDIKYLVNISNKIGKRCDYTQGGGGNTSVKINSENMAIKASGTTLQEMSLVKGFVIIKYKDLIDFIFNPNFVDTDEDKINKYICSLSLDKGLRPSIEAGLHSLIDKKFVLHTHSIYANVLCCSDEGEEILKKLFPDAVYLNYHSPGKYITNELAKKLKNSSSNKVIFLQNHGLVVADNYAKDLLLTHEYVNNTIINYLKINKISSFDNKNYNHVGILFPDQIVYSSTEDTDISAAKAETIGAYNYIIQIIFKNKLTPRYLKDSEISYIKSMESEKYREKIIK